MMENNKQEGQIFDKLNIYGYRLANESFEDYKERQRIGNKIIKQYLKGRVVYACYQTFDVPMKQDGSKEEKPKTKKITLRVLPPYTNPTKNDWRKPKTNN